MKKLLVVVDKLGGVMSWEVEDLKSFVDGEILDFSEMSKENYDNWKEDVEFPEIVHTCMREGKKVFEVSRTDSGDDPDYYAENEFDGETLAWNAIVDEYQKVFLIKTAQEAAEVANTYRGKSCDAVFYEILFSSLFGKSLEEVESGKLSVKMKYVTRDREAGNIIDEFATLAEAEAAINEYEEDDRRRGIYEPDFYEVAEIED